MRVFVAGATGALGSRLVPMLAARGHDVTAMSRRPESHDTLPASGAKAVVADGLDRNAVIDAIVRARPEVIVHQMTALAGDLDMRRFERTFEATNRLRTEGTENLLEGARRVGAHRFVAQSFGGWPYARVGGMVKTEDDPLDDDPPSQLRTTLEAIKRLESLVLGEPALEGLVLRYGGFYGPGTSFGRGGRQTEMVRRRRFPIVGDGGGVWSLIQIDDAASATAAAIERGGPGAYNVGDDEPAPVATWLPYLADLLGAKPPRRVPAWLARLVAGEHGVVMMTSLRGISNAKAKRELGWEPTRRSWRDGFRELA